MCHQAHFLVVVTGLLVFWPEKHTKRRNFEKKTLVAHSCVLFVVVFYPGERLLKRVFNCLFSSSSLQDTKKTTIHVKIEYNWPIF